MTYRCSVGESTFLYIVQRGSQTEALMISEGPRRSQSMTSLDTGVWSAPPVASRGAEGITVQIRAAQGNFVVRARGSSLAMTPGQEEPGELIELDVVEAVPGAKPVFGGADIQIHDMRVEMNAFRASREMKVDWDSPSQSN